MTPRLILRLTNRAAQTSASGFGLLLLQCPSGAMQDALSLSFGMRVCLGICWTRGLEDSGEHSADGQPGPPLEPEGHQFWSWEVRCLHRVVRGGTEGGGRCRGGAEEPAWRHRGPRESVGVAMVGSPGSV